MGWTITMLYPCFAFRCIKLLELIGQSCETVEKMWLFLEVNESSLHEEVFGWFEIFTVIWFQCTLLACGCKHYEETIPSGGVPVGISYMGKHWAVFKFEVFTCISMWRASEESHFKSRNSSNFFATLYRKKKLWYWPFCIECENNMMSHYIEEVHAIKWCTKTI